jgi:hypothetical protein
MIIVIGDSKKKSAIVERNRSEQQLPLTPDGRLSEDIYGVAVRRSRKRIGIEGLSQQLNPKPKPPSKSTCAKISPSSSFDLTMAIFLAKTLAVASHS